MPTVRQQMIDLLQEGEYTAREISQALSVMEKDVYGHLAHIEHSLSRQGQKLVVRPFICLNCGYAFAERRRWSRPGRCPVCQHSHIRRASYRIEEA